MTLYLEKKFFYFPELESTTTVPENSACWVVTCSGLGPPGDPPQAKGLLHYKGGAIFSPSGQRLEDQRENNVSQQRFISSNFFCDFFVVIKYMYNTTFTMFTILRCITQRH